MIPSLPQNDSAEERKLRAQQLQAACASVTYDHNTSIAPLGVAMDLPKEYQFSLITLGAGASVILAMVDNALTMAAPLVNRENDRVMLPDLSDQEQKDAATCLNRLRSQRNRLTGHMERAVAGCAPPPPPSPARGLRALGKAVEELAHGLSAAERGLHAVERGAEALKEGAEALKTGLEVRLGRDSGGSPFEWLEELVKTLADDVLKRVLESIGLAGPAADLYAYFRQFSILVPPPIASSFEDDELFAWMRLAGPNPMVIRGVPALPDNLPLTDAQFQKVMGSEDSLAKAGSEGRLFLCDYAVLATLPQSSYPYGTKYTAAPLALFATPASGGRLKPVAIQLGQTPARDNPIFQPADGAAWRLACAYVNCADGNHHEMVSHLGLTHLVVEGFAVSTPRQLAPEHPLFVLLMPHLQGTLAINSAAVSSLIAPEGTVDKLLAGTIGGLTQLAVSAALNADLSKMAPPIELAARGVDNTSALPEFPYRDDALLIWEAITGWVTEYLSVYYATDADIAGDTELAGWLAELASPQGAGLKGIPSGTPTFDQLVSLVSTVIFTASAQHATVNFPQATIMAFTPAMPLAMYRPAPTSKSVADGTLAASLPPLQQSFLQLAFLNLLGGVYFTRLGDYDRYLSQPYFSDPRVRGPLSSFQSALMKAEHVIGARNMRRPTYTTLLPTAIPQSINI